ncbi:MAG: ATP-binding cassette domain-containing protein [Rhizobiales bacterium]|nr:ATP-binding cassette domain-containing protein [Hyphomicrobiales bacterium]
MTAKPKLDAAGVVVRLGDALIVDGAALDLRAGELTVLIGPNGAGKTTLMRALAGLIPAEGRIDIDGRSLSALTIRERARRIAYLPQGHVFHWPMPVADVVALGRYPHADAFSMPTDDDRHAVKKALAATGTETFANRPVTTLSGGERARVALARALACEAPILLADEPTVSLDPRHQLVVMELLARAAHDGGAVLAIGHDLALAARFADRIVIMDRGRLVADGKPRDVLTAERIASVFGVEAVMTDDAIGPHPILLRPL